MSSNHKTLSILGALALLGSAGLRAQTPEVPAPATPPAAEAQPDLPTLQAAAREAEAKLPAPELKPQIYFDLGPVQRDRWQAFLPQTLLKLTRRERVQIVVLGDAILDGRRRRRASIRCSRALPGVFAKALATQFYYTGGVRVVRPGSKLRSKDNMVMGPEILLQPVRTSPASSPRPRRWRRWAFRAGQIWCLWRTDWKTGWPGSPQRMWPPRCAACATRLARIASK
jgi:hypothetical protein